MGDRDDPGGSSRGRREGRTIGILQAGRGAAALAVLAYHAAYSVHDFAAPVPVPVFHAFEHGTYGVDFFFVLSGFIILHAHAGDPPGAGPAGRYLRKRLTRIFVPYLPVCLAMIGLYLALPGVSGAGRDWGLLTSLTLLPTGRPPALAAAWTLVHEMMFYGVFLLSYVVPGFRVLATAWVGLILAGMAWGLETSYPAPDLRSLFAPINLEFVAGMLAAVAAARLPPSRAVPCLLAGLAGLAAYFGLGVDPAGPLRPALGAAFALIVLGGVLMERGGRLRVPGWLLVLGNASYAVYLVHAPLTSVAARVLGRLGAPGGWPLGVAVCIAVGVAGGLAYHLAFERPALALARGRPPKSVAAAP